ncbi:Hypothetical protein CINCED_3A016207 [Cinara cedri]|uniref:Uncharacterized protein n=1 Tax=Cinara cedri TaxID=506608 RepID=A0A5E4NLF9_9HEMI|nr:Hypothetical protein CINCED_3A016207 [Cinara cedri]
MYSINCKVLPKLLRCANECSTDHNDEQLQRRLEIPFLTFDDPTTHFNMTIIIGAHLSLEGIKTRFSHQFNHHHFNKRSQLYFGYISCFKAYKKLMELNKRCTNTEEKKTAYREDNECVEDVINALPSLNERTGIILAEFNDIGVNTGLEMPFNCAFFVLSEYADNAVGLIAGYIVHMVSNLIN